MAGGETMDFGLSVSDAYLAATVTAAAVAKHHGVQAFIHMSQMTLAQMRMTETTASPQHTRHWLAEQALNWSGLPVVHVRSTVLLEGFFQMFTSIRSGNHIRSDDRSARARRCRSPWQTWPGCSPRGSPIRRRTSARSIHPTGPQSENRHCYAQEYSKALGRTITSQDMPVEPWRDGLLERGLPGHLVNHLATMADLHRAGRDDRMSDDVLTLTGQGPLRVQELVRKHAGDMHRVGNRGLSVGGGRGARMVARATASHAGEEEETTWHIWSLTKRSRHFSSSIRTTSSFPREATYGIA